MIEKTGVLTFNQKQKWKAAAALVVDNEYSEATKNRQARLKNEFEQFIDSYEFNNPLDYDEVYVIFVEHFEQHQTNILSSCGNCYKTPHKEHFYRQLDMIARLSIQMISRSKYPVALISSEVANKIFNYDYPDNTMVFV